MTCGHCVGSEKIFGAKKAKRDLARYRRKGASRPTQMLIDEIRRRGVDGAVVLDVGAGVGAVHLELLARGAARAIDVDASPAYQDAARGEAQARGFAGQVEYRAGDFLDVASDLAPADVVCLDRVVCCYPDMRGLVSESANRSTRLLGLVFPVDRTWLKIAFAVVNAGLRLARNPFRTFLHPTADVEAEAVRQGFEKVFHDRAGIWQVLLFERPAVSHG